MSNQRILFVEEARGFGGSVTALARTAGALRNRGFTIHAVITSADPRSVEALTRAGASVHVLPLARRSARISARLEALNRSLKPAKLALLLGVTVQEFFRRILWLVRFNKLLGQVRPDVVHFNNGPAFNAPGMLWSARKGLPTVVTVRGGEWCGRLGRAAQKRASKVIFISEHMRRSNPCAGENALVLYDGVDLAEFPAPTARRCPDGLVRFVHVGMFMEWKGQDLFLKAARNVAQKHANVEFSLVGQAVDDAQRAYAESLHSLAAGEPLKDRVRFLGFHSQVLPILEKMDVLVHSSTRPEPFGLVIVEGMACGLAIVTPDEGGPREIVRNGIDGLLVAPRDAEALANAMEQLAADPGRIVALAASARRRVEQEFSSDRTAEKLSELYRSLGR